MNSGRYVLSQVLDLVLLIGNRFLWEGDGKQVVLVKAPD